MDDEDEEQMRAALHNYFILSYDTLRSVPIPQEDLLTINHSLAKNLLKNNGMTNLLCHPPNIEKI